MLTSVFENWTYICRCNALISRVHWHWTKNKIFWLFVQMPALQTKERNKVDNYFGHGCIHSNAPVCMNNRNLSLSQIPSTFTTDIKNNLRKWAIISFILCIYSTVKMFVDDEKQQQWTSPTIVVCESYGETMTTSIFIRLIQGQQYQIKCCLVKQQRRCVFF